LCIKKQFFLVQKQVTSWNHWEGWRCEIILGKVYLFNPFTEGAIGRDGDVKTILLGQKAV